VQGAGDGAALVELGLHDAGDAKVAQLDAAGVGDEDVGAMLVVTTSRRSALGTYIRHCQTLTSLNSLPYLVA
jgi:hypothetical protein